MSMEVILLFVAGFIVFFIAILSVVKMITNRVSAPINNLENEMVRLEKRVSELEKWKEK